MNLSVARDLRRLKDWLGSLSLSQAPEESVPPFEDHRAGFAGLFSAVLRHVSPDWGDPGQYLAAVAPAAVELSEFACPYHVLIISGIFSQGLSPAVRAFSDACAHLRTVHSFAVEYLDVAALGSCEYNAKTIACYLRRQLSKDPTPYIVVGYSQGAANLQVMLANHPDLVPHIIALITVAGCIGGSHLLDEVPVTGLPMPFPDVHIGNWELGDGGAVNSLRCRVRSEFLEQHSRSPVPTYSIATCCSWDETSSLLGASWKLLHIHFPKQDSQMVTGDQIVPGGKLLATARADHWAVAMPFEDLHDVVVDRLLNRNHYPRTALLEAALRYTVRDLAAATR